MKKETITAKISVHYLQARIIWQLQSGGIDLAKDSLRDIGNKVGLKPNSAQKIKHHLGSLVKLGVLNIRQLYT